MNICTCLLDTRIIVLLLSLIIDHAIYIYILLEIERIGTGMRRKLQITDTSAEEIEAGKSSESTVDESIIARNDKMSWIVQGTSK